MKKNKKWNKVKGAFKKIAKPFINVFQNDESRFRFLTTFKITLIPVFSLALMSTLLIIVLQMTLNAFVALSVSQSRTLEAVFYDYALRSYWESMPLLLVLLILQVFLGIYISNLFLRPFKMIGLYCKGVLEGEKGVNYDPDFYTDLKLLTRFGEYFFNIAENSLKHEDFKPHEIPQKFQRIHKPVFERDFFIQFSFFIILTSIIFGAFIHMMMLDVFDEVIVFANRTLPLTSQVQVFLNRQADILQNVFWLIVALHVLLNLILSVHLYSRVSGPAFGIFATMRSFLRGNKKSRVHLIGHYYVRNQCRYFNKYLDYIERNCMK